jgi:hypothetical protein
MSVKHAMEMFHKVDDVRGHCLAFGIDSCIQSDLPEDFYDLSKSNYDSEGDIWNNQIDTILTEFFETKPDKGDQSHPRAIYSAYSANPQSYCPDVAYKYPEVLARLGHIPEVEKKQRLENLLKQASSLGCAILFFSSDQHIKSLQTIEDINGPRFVVREYGLIQSDRLYTPQDLSGRSISFGHPSDSCSPLPEVEEAYFPAGQSSWELLILPPN